MTAATTLDRRALIVALASAGAIPSRVWAAAGAGDWPALRAFLDGLIMSGKLPGAVLAIRRGERPVQYISAGTLAFDTKAPAGPDSLWRIYSMTKPIVGMAAMKLIEQGHLSLDQPLAEILPDFKEMQVIADPNTMMTRPAKAPILIRHLLTHTSGLGYDFLPSPAGRLYAKNGIKPGTRAIEPGPGELPPARDLETFASRLSKLPLDFDPGARWQYAVGMDLMGLVIQRVSGVGLYDYVRTSFFEPLKMHDTDFMVPKSKLERFATVMTLDHGKLVDTDDRKSSPFARDRDLPSAGGGLVSSARDYMRFNMMMLNEGVLDGARVVKPETVRTARSNLLPAGVTSFFGGFGAAMSVVLPGGQRPGQDPPGSYGWFGIAGTQMWIDPVNRFSVALMLQILPSGTYGVREQVRLAAYKDLAGAAVAA
jgi:CubicO group peptidase (beta-lactamase class C family)